MASKPSTPAQVIKGKFISATEGFADTFNWLAQTLFNLKGGNGIKIFWADDTHPTIELEENKPEEEEEDPEGTSSKTTFNGTDGSSSTSSTVNFISAEDANVVVTCNDGSSESTDITIGVYYV